MRLKRLIGVLLAVSLIAILVAGVRFLKTTRVPESKSQIAKRVDSPAAAKPPLPKPELNWPLHSYQWAEKSDKEANTADGFRLSGQRWDQVLAQRGVQQTLLDWPDDIAGERLRRAVQQSKFVIESAPQIAWQVALNQLDVPDDELRSLLGAPPESTRYLPRFRPPISNSRLQHVIPKYGGRYSMVVLSNDNSDENSDELSDSRLFVTSDTYGFAVWDLDTASIKKRFKTKKRYTKYVSASPDQKWFAGGTEREPMILWDRAEDKSFALESLVAKGDEELARGAPLDFSSDSKRLLLLHYQEHRRGYQMRQPVIFDFESGEVKRLSMSNCDVNMARFFPDNVHVLVALLDVSQRESSAHLVVANSHTGKVVKRLDTFGSGTSSMTFASDASVFATTPFGKSMIQLWRGESMEPIADLPTKAKTTAGLSMSADGNQLAAIDQNGDVWQWDLSTKTSRHLGTHGTLGRAVTFTADGKQIISSAKDNTFRIFDAFTSDDFSSDVPKPTIKLKPQDIFAISPDGHKMAVCFENGPISIWNARTGEGIFDLNQPSNSKLPVTAIAFSPDGRRLVASSVGESINIWDATTGQKLDRVRLNDHLSRMDATRRVTFFTDTFSAIRFSRDGKRLALAEPKYIRSFDRDTKELAWFDSRKRNWMNGNERVSMFRDVDTNGDGSIVASITTKYLTMRRVSTGEIVRRIKSPIGLAPDKSLSLSCDAAQVAASIGDRTWIWNVATGKMFGERMSRTACRFFDNAQDKLLTGSGDGTVYLLDLSDEQETPLFCIGERVSEIHTDQTGTIAVRGGSGNLYVFQPTESEQQRQREWKRSPDRPALYTEPGKVIPTTQSFAQWREQFESDLPISGPPRSTGRRSRAPTIDGVETVRFKTQQGNLEAWVYQPPSAQGPLPAIIYLPGGHSLGPDDLTNTISITGDNFVVMTPMLRGENGMPGNHELFLGEAEDARDAARFLAKHTGVDPKRIYAFGHSAGGGVSAMLSLLGDVPIRHSASCGGLYPAEVFDDWSDTIPFRNTMAERKARLLIGNESHMLRDHHAYVGVDDSLEQVIKQATLAPTSGARLSAHRIPGDHFTSLNESLKRYVEVIQSEKSSQP